MCGGFHRIPPLSATGFVVRVTSVHGHQWVVAVVPFENSKQWLVCLVDQVPWDQWIDARARTSYSIYRGDHPAQYMEFKRAATAGSPEM